MENETDLIENSIESIISIINYHSGLGRNDVLENVLIRLIDFENKNGVQSHESVKGLIRRVSSKI